MFPTELTVVKSKLESEGIECRVLDENTIQAHNFLSQALGGVRLQVAESNLNKAKKILEEIGLSNEVKKIEESQIEKTFANPKFQRKIRVLIIGLAFISIVFVTTLFALSYLNKPSDVQLLTDGNWCVDYIVYQNEEYLPFTLSNEVKMKIIGKCSEKLDFETTGHVHFPGFNSSRINGRWKLEDNLINVSQLDTFNFLLERKYEYEINQKKLILDADTLKIYCSNIKYRY